MHILIVRNNSNPKAIDASLLLATYFSTQGIAYSILDSTDLGESYPQEKIDEILESEPIMAVALGGDGTILRTARLLGQTETPILGINFGHLGFLANPSEDGVVAIVAEALSDGAVLEKRANLQIDVVLEGENDPYDDEACAGVGDAAFAGGEPIGKALAGDEFAGDEFAGDGPADDAAKGGSAGCTSKRSFFALNEMAITRGTMGRIIDFALSVSDAHISDMRGDGLVVASATGSTAYALSAGGPLVAPSYMGLVVVPLAPHTIRSRALLTGESDVVRIDLEDNYASREATLFLDGEIVPFDKPIRRIYVRRGAYPTALLRYSNRSFYEHAAETFF